MFLGLIFIFFALLMLFRHVFLKKKEVKKKNHYIEEHQAKVKDDKKYDEYLEWCVEMNESPVDKEGFEKHRNAEYEYYRKLGKYGISRYKK